MVTLNAQINKIANDAIYVMLTNDKVGYKEFHYCTERILQLRLRTFKLLSVAETKEDITLIRDTFESRVGFLKVFATVKTKKNTTEELTED